jgi:6-phosphofructokinase 1
MTKRVGILTSGGDCAGLNAIIRSAVHRADVLGWEMYAIEDGTMGLLHDPPRARLMHAHELNADIMRLGGTFLGTTNKGNPFAFPMPDGSLKDRSGEICQSLETLGLDALIGIGGDGSMKILSRLAEKAGIRLIGIPKTIDNDIGETETSVGFDTAVSIATETLDRLQPTAASHDRVMVLEVMGRDAGHIALNAGISGGADIILIPEIDYSIDAVTSKLHRIKENGRNFGLMVISEAVKTPAGEARRVELGGEHRYGGIGHYLGTEIAEATGFDTRVTVLGHVQRGAAPTHSDRLLASAMGVHAVDLVAEGKRDRMVAWQNRQVVDVSINDAVAAYQDVDIDGTLIHTARALGISLGDD